MSAPSPLAPLAFLTQTVITQIIALGSALLAWEGMGSVAVSVAVATAVGIGVSTFLQLPTPWRIVNLLLPISIVSSLAISLPHWIFAFPLTALAMLHAPALWTRVPYYPTSRAAYPLILAELPPGQEFTFIDIGCGCGDLLVFLKRHRPMGRYVGVEIGIFPYLSSKIKSFLYGDGAITIRFQDLQRTDLGDCDYVYAFLSPAAMTTVWNKAYREMKVGSTFITNSFEAPSTATYTVAVRDGRQSSLFIHRMEHSRNETPTRRAKEARG